MRLPRHIALPIPVPQRAAMSLLAGFLLVLYLVGGLWRAPGQPHAHDRALDIHFAGCETDPCHSAVYHVNRPGACHHKAHLTRNIDEDCSLCGIMVFRQDLPPKTASFTLQEGGSAVPVMPREALAVCARIVPFSRGPPIV